ncbi:MAG: hypothetical protein LC667_13400 [Thioalkalivibrio sp.]|nr:hypothetical protein [Thioalkalivibrio sp.]
MDEYSDKASEKFKQAIRRFKADQRIWREGRVAELRERVLCSSKEADERDNRYD